MVTDRQVAAVMTDSPGDSGEQQAPHRQLVSDVASPHVFISHHTRDLLRLALQLT